MLAFRSARLFTAALAAMVACAAHAQTLDELYEKAKQEKSLVCQYRARAKLLYNWGSRANSKLGEKTLLVRAVIKEPT
jgi:hypothetical protein